MRVGIDYRPALVNGEGIGRYTRELVRGLVELSFDANLGLFGYTLAPIRRSIEELGIAGTRAELLRLRLPSRWVPWLLGKLGKGVDDAVGGADVYHHTQYHLMPVRRAVEVATLHDCIYMLDAGYMEQATAERMRNAARAMVARAKRLLVPSEFVGAEAVLHFGVWPKQVAVTHLGCDHVARHLPPPSEIPRPKTPFVLTVSRVDPRKNHLRMLSAFERLVADGLPHRWLVVGPRGWNAELFERALDASPARDRVEWRRDVGEVELALLYAQADVLLFASLNEGFGLPLVEAMAAGTAVVASAVTSMPEIADDAAWLVEPTDVDDVFEATRRILREPELRESFELKGRQRARRFTWKETARQTLNAYRGATTPDEEEKPGLLRSL